MKSKLLHAVCLLLSLTVFSSAVEPNYIRTTVHNVNSTDGAAGTEDVVTTVYSDGLGREIQTKVRLDESRDRVLSVFYDEAGRQTVTTKPYIDNSTAGYFSPGDLTDVKAKLQNEYATSHPQDKDYAYSEVTYYNDPTGRVKKAGAPGVKNHINSGNAVETWYFGVSRPSLDNIPVDVNFSLESGTVVFNDGFVTEILENTGYDTAQVFDELYDHLLSAVENPFGTPNHHLTVTRDAGRKLTQSLADGLGRTVATWADPTDVPGDEIVARYKYDILGNVLEEDAPGNHISNTKYNYNTLGQLIRKETPDGAIEVYEYDDAGNLKVKTKYFKDPTKNQGENEIPRQKITYKYDTFSRLITIYEHPFKETYFGFPEMRVKNYFEVDWSQVLITIA